MRLAIADPPYLGRGRRRYGDGYGGDGTADFHPDAAEWDDPARHARLVAEMEESFDGWAVAANAASLPVYLAAAHEHVPVPDSHGWDRWTAQPVRVAVWHKPNAPASANRLRGAWEPVILRLPPTRRAHGTGPAVDDVLRAPNEIGRGFIGAKPRAWTRWVLDALGYRPDVDELVDLFPGSGAVAGEAAQGVLL